MRVLVADDDPIYLTLITRQVLTWTDEVLSADSGTNACRVLLQDPTIELAILDRVMPGMDAIEVCKQVRSTRGPLPYIIIITAHDSNGDILEALENGADDYIRKPFLPAELKARADVGRRTSKLQRELLQQCKASQQREAEIRSLLQSTSEGICGVDRLGRCTSVNRAAAAVLGYSETELLGKKMHDLIHHHHGDGTPYPPEECPIVKTARTGTSEHKSEELLWKRDGTSFRARYSANPIVTEDGAITGAVMAFSDITEELRLRERMQQSAKLEAVGRLAGGVAHDFNNLLMAITAHTELLQGRLSRDVANSDSCAQILAACNRGASLTSRLLGFGRKQMASRTILDLNKAVEEELRIVSRIIGEDIRIELRLGEGPLGVAIDPNQFSQVLLNLAINARDAMPHGGDLVIATGTHTCLGSSGGRTWMTPGEYVTLSLTDSGDGIPEDVREHIFEPFFTTKGPKGTGLGLASVYGVVKQSGGYIDFESSASGTTFTMYFHARQLDCDTTTVVCMKGTCINEVVDDKEGDCCSRHSRCTPG